MLMAGLPSPAEALCSCLCRDGKVVAYCGTFDINTCHQEMCEVKPKPFHLKRTPVVKEPPKPPPEPDKPKTNDTQQQ